MDGDPIRALTGRRRTRPTSIGCRNPWQPKPGRAPLIAAHAAVQTNRATSKCGSPQGPAHRRKSVAEGEVPFLVPGSATGLSQPANTRVAGPEGHEGEQAEQSRRRSRNGLVRPLALCLHTQVPAHLCKGHLRGPAADKPTQDIERIGAGPCTGTPEA